MEGNVMAYKASAPGDKNPQPRAPSIIGAAAL